MGPKLWKVENYLDFLGERRKLLAAAGNELLKKLHAGDVPEPPVMVDRVSVSMPVVAPGAVESEDEEAALRACNDWVIARSTTGSASATHSGKKGPNIVCRGYIVASPSWVPHISNGRGRTV